MIELSSEVLRQLLAMTESSFSNSLIDSWWRALKHQWLYLNSLDSGQTIEKLVPSTSMNTTLVFPIPNFVDRLLMRCTSELASTSPPNLRPQRERRDKLDSRRTVELPARRVNDPTRPKERRTKPSKKQRVFPNSSEDHW